MPNMLFFVSHQAYQSYTRSMIPQSSENQEKERISDVFMINSKNDSFCWRKSGYIQRLKTEHHSLRACHNGMGFTPRVTLHIEKLHPSHVLCKTNWKRSHQMLLRGMKRFFLPMPYKDSFMGFQTYFKWSCRWKCYRHIFVLIVLCIENHIVLSNFNMVMNTRV